MMKSAEEIQKLAEEKIPDENLSIYGNALVEDRRKDFIQGFTESQEDKEKYAQVKVEEYKRELVKLESKIAAIIESHIVLTPNNSPDLTKYRYLSAAEGNKSLTDLEKELIEWKNAFADISLENIQLKNRIKK